MGTLEMVDVFVYVFSTCPSTYQVMEFGSQSTPYVW